MGDWKEEFGKHINDIINERMEKLEETEAKLELEKMYDHYWLNGTKCPYKYQGGLLGVIKPENTYRTCVHISHQDRRKAAELICDLFMPEVLEIFKEVTAGGIKQKINEPLIY